MKSVFNKIEKEKPKEIVFPVLAEYIKGDSFVVMFLNMKYCVCVSSMNQAWLVGECHINLTNVTDKTYWRILSPEESIMLSND